MDFFLVSKKRRGYFSPPESQRWCTCPCKRANPPKCVTGFLFHAGSQKLFIGGKRSISTDPGRMNDTSCGTIRVFFWVHSHGVGLMAIVFLFIRDS